MRGDGRQSMRVIFVFQLSDSDVYALSYDLSCLRHLNDESGPVWRLRQLIRPSEPGQSYLEAATLLRDRYVCLIKVISDYTFQCVCDEWKNFTQSIKGKVAPDPITQH
jgi:hypothetical protein